MELGIRGKVAIVTGASKGIGRAIAEELAIEGVNLALAARSEQDLNVVSENIRSRWNVSALPVPCDLKNISGVQELVDKTMMQYGKVDILCNVAGSIRAGTLLSKPDNDWIEDWNLKLFGYIRIMRALFPIMHDGGGGRIVNIIGNAGRKADPAYLAGGGANAALMNITKGIAAMGGPHNILVNAINPGPTRTERWDSLNEQLAFEWKMSSSKVESKRMENNPMKRPCEPSEIASLAVFLVSKRASYINGAIIDMEGGSNCCI